MNLRILEIDSIAQAERAVADTGADPYAVRLMAPKAFVRTAMLEGVDNRAAALIKQEMLAAGGDAAVNRDISRFVRGTSRVLVLGTRKQYDRLIAKLKSQPFGLKEWAVRLDDALVQYDRERFVLPCGGKKLVLGPRPAVMGIVNVTPDSFSDGGVYADPERAAARGEELAEAGARIIDVGGESTRPGARPVPVKEETARVVPVIRKLARRSNILISIDTRKPDVARAALDAGAAVVNDISGLRHDGGRMARVVGEYRVPVVLMHMQGAPGTMQQNPRYRDVVADIGGFFARRIDELREQGVMPEQVILDPGIGFGKTAAHNLEILRRLAEFRTLGRPLAVGTSRKAFIGAVAGGAPPADRLPGTIATCVWAACKGALLLRVHDAAETAQAIAVLEAIRCGVH